MTIRILAPETVKAVLMEAMCQELVRMLIEEQDLVATHVDVGKRIAAPEASTPAFNPGRFV
ncbi:hypothetical protein [Shimia sp. Alg240-R146]|uniref:hypothetical protein n=1 Tax=Shimia sp. Alg240-R146 TaxID=2993449 RepID=UPI0022E915ED|nr:hypothetical protein [Shimia sp. Alg240-R146]